MCQFVSFFSAMFLPNIICIGLQLGKLSQNKKGELFIETQCKYDLVYAQFLAE